MIPWYHKLMIPYMIYIAQDFRWGSQPGRGAAGSRLKLPAWINQWPSPNHRSTARVTPGRRRVVTVTVPPPATLRGSDGHGVPVLDPKNTTNLKCYLNRIKIMCTNVVPTWTWNAPTSLSIWQYTASVVGTRCRQNSADIECGQSGWLARRLGEEPEKLHRKSGTFAILGLRKLEPVRARLPGPLDADSSRFEIQK